MNWIKQNKLAAVAVLVTFILAVVAVFTAMRLYNLRQTAVAPNVPESTPGATDTNDIVSCDAVAFTIGVEESPSPSPTSSPSPTASSSPSASASPSSSATPSSSPSSSPTAPPIGGAPTPTTTPKSSVTPRPTTGATPTATTPGLPQAGVATPTFAVAISGIVLLLGALVLAK